MFLFNIKRTLHSRTLLWGWLRTGVFELRNGAEERFVWLRLPSYGMGYCINIDEERWGQRVLMYRGHCGFSFHWYFASESVSHG